MAQTKSKKEKLSVNRLMILVVVVNRKKAEYYADLIQSFDANLQFVGFGEGTVKPGMLGYTGLAENDKAIIISVIRADREKEALRTIGDKFKSVKDGKGIAYTVSMTSVIGSSIFSFLSNQRNTFMNAGGTDGHK
ncbi:MAG: hypothetical protein K5796_07515 [Lachnospiraceae bacterium]|nr:hypothetical protein [Lachnospiraceae bacterium]